MARKICAACGHLGNPHLLTKGSLLMEVFLWCLFIIPGLIYSIWRHASRAYVCEACHADEPLPIDSPRGRRLVDDYYGDMDVSSTTQRLGRAIGRFVAGDK
jgi:hypothetical protein